MAAMKKFTSTLYFLTLFVLFAGIFFISLQKPVVIDYEESVSAEISRAMHAAGEPILPSLNGVEFFAKPPMLSWAQMLGYQMFGVNALGARFFNGVAALATILVFYFGTVRPLGSRVAFNSSLVLGSSIMFIYLARVALPDMLLTLFLVSCIMGFWYGIECYLIDKSGSVFFWLACFCASLAMLTTGTISLLLPVLTAICYLLSIGRPGALFNRKWLLPGTAIIVLGGFSWYLLIGFMHPDGFEFMKELFITHHAGLLSSPVEGHSGSIFYYLIILFVGFMPWFGYLPRALLNIPLKRTGQPGHRYLRLFGLFSIIVFLFFSIVDSKLPYYILPALPGFALLIGYLFESRGTTETTGTGTTVGWRIAGWTGAVPAGLLGIVLFALPLVFPFLAELTGEDAYKVPALFEPVELGWSPYLAGALFLLSAGLLVHTVRASAARLFETLVICSLINGCTLFFLVIPLYDRLIDAPLTSLAEEAAALSPPNGIIVMYEIDDRPSVNFVSGLTTIEHDERELQDLPALFERPEITTGLTTSFYFEGMQNRGMKPVEIGRNTGFVLFRFVPTTGELPEG